MENKTFHTFATKADDQGVVEAIVAVMGNVDDGGDVIHPGAFTKTINERSAKIKVLDAHRYDSTMRIVGKPLELRELGRAELPLELLQRYPDAIGGLWTKTQFLLDTPEGAGVFKRIKAGALDEWSIGYDALDSDFSKITKDGKEITVRNLRTCKLYEYSPVLWGMNSATSTLGAKSAPEEGKPWRAVREGDTWRVYKLDENGDPTGEALGEHDNEDAANEQVRALYASEKPKARDIKTLNIKLTTPSDVAERFLKFLWMVSRAASVGHSNYFGFYLDGDGSDRPFDIDGVDIPDLSESDIVQHRDFESVKGIDTPNKSAKAGRVLAARNASRIMDAVRLLTEALSDAGLTGNDDERTDKSAEAGPEPPPTDKTERLLKSIEIELAQIGLLEV